MNTSNLATTFLFSLFFCLSAAQVVGEEKAAADEKAQAGSGQSLANLLSLEVQAEEKALIEALKKAMEENLARDAGGALKGRALEPVTLRQAAMRALERNLAQFAESDYLSPRQSVSSGIQLSAHDIEVKKALLEEARAVFLPVFSVDLSANETRTEYRKRTAIIEHKDLNFATNPNPTPIPDFPPPSEIIRLNMLGFNMITEPGFVFASKRGKDNPDQSASYTVAIDQQLPWGPSLRLSNLTVYQDRHVKRDAREYDHPWTSNFFVDLTVPVPFTAGFGPYAPADTNIKLAKVEAKKSFASFKAVLNAVLLSVDRAYWTLVYSAKNIQIQRGNRQLVEKTVRMSEDLLKNGRATEYDKDQGLAELDRQRGLEESYWNSFLAASNRLAELLDLEPGKLLFPYGYEPLGKEPLKFDQANAVKQGLESRSELHAAKMDEKYLKILVRHKEQMTLPNMVMGGSLALKQSNSTIGFHTFADSYGHLFGEDSRTRTGTFAYSRSLFLNGEKGQRDQARAQLDAQGLQTQATENQVEREVNDGLAWILTAQARLEAARAACESARQAYDSTVQMREAGRLTEFELVNRLRSRLEAEVEFNGAQYGLKLAESYLLYAQGLLPGLYPERTAPSALDQYRIELLKANEVLQFFGAENPSVRTASAEKK